MKFKSNIKSLRESLSKLSIIPGAKAAGPAANLVKIECGMEGIDCTRTTGEGSITINREAEIEDNEGSLILDYSKLSRVLGELAGKSDNIEVESDAKFVTLRAGRATGKLAIMPPDAFFPALEFKKGKTATMQALYLVKSLKIAFAALSPEVNKPELLGVCFRDVLGKPAVFGTDGRRFHVGFLDCKTSLDCMVPIEGASAILTALEGDTSKVKITASENGITFETSTAKVMSAICIDKPGNMEPLFTRIDENDAAATITANRAGLISAIKTATIGAFGEGNAIDIKLDGEELCIIGDNQSDTAMDDRIDCECDNPFEFSISADYLKQAVEAMKGEGVTLEYFDGKFKAIYMREDDRITFVAPVQKS